MHVTESHVIISPLYKLAITLIECLSKSSSNSSICNDSMDASLSMSFILKPTLITGLLY